jgi:hypothetical protein
MQEHEVVRFISSLSGVVVVTASEASGAPEVAWGDSFFSYDPLGVGADDWGANFATVVTKDYEGFDTASDLNRPGVFRLNLGVGRRKFQEVLGFAPADHADRSAGIDYAVLDTVIPHPVYATQGWVSIVSPGARTSDEVRALIAYAHRRAMERYDPAAADRPDPPGDAEPTERPAG